MSLLFLVLAFVLFILAGFTAPWGKFQINLGWFGLASLTLAIWLLPALH